MLALRSPADTLPMFEGCIVASVDGDEITLSLARQAIDPSTRQPSYQVSLTLDQTGRSLLIWSGDQAGELYAVTDSAAMTITCAGASFADLAAGEREHL